MGLRVRTWRPGFNPWQLQVSTLLFFDFLRVSPVVSIPPLLHSHLIRWRVIKSSIFKLGVAILAPNVAAYRVEKSALYYIRV
jgi:hypothetical protein